MLPCVFASELAALSGRNPYKSPEQVRDDIWRRTHAMPSTRDEAIARIAQNPAALRAALPLANCPDFDAVLADSPPTAAADFFIELAAQEQLPPSAFKLDLPEAQVLQSTISCKIGTNLETAGLDRFEQAAQQPVVQRNAHGFRKRLPEFVIYGRVDGALEDGTIVEHKQRRNRLFHSVPDYERVQVLAYMFLADAPSAIIVETFRDQQASHQIPWDQALWDAVVADATREIGGQDADISTQRNNSNGNSERRCAQILPPSWINV